MKIVSLILLILTTVSGRRGFGLTEQEWGYVTVREGAHMFWWLHKTSADVTSFTDRPLVIWLQGGPGTSSTGYGNFAEVGPLDPDLNVRNTTWLNNVNLLFVDNPVGTGFSYVDSLDALTTNNTQIAEDFVVFLRAFYEGVPELQSVPLYIFCESYGGKMAVEIALLVDQATRGGVINATLVGVGLGDSWVSPLDAVLSWGQYLLALGFVDQNGAEQIEASAKVVEEAYNSGAFSLATDLWTQTEILVKVLTANMNFYNVLTEVSVPNVNGPNDNSKIYQIMNNQVKTALEVDRVWGLQSNFVFSYLAEDFMKPVTNIVELLLNTTDIKVAVYNGQLDFLVDILGTTAWINKLKFEGSDTWKTVERNPIVVDSVVQGYYKKLNNLALYWVNRAGHMVPHDNPMAMQYILEDVTNNFSV